MTNHWQDIANSDCVLIMGSNPAENHPISFKWVLKAVERGATLIHVDPRFTRTSAKAHFHVPLRSGTDIAFLGGMIKYILDNKLYFAEYLHNYTNASFIVGDKYGFKDGLFSGYDPEARQYDKSFWAFALDEKGVPKRDPEFASPNCVLNLLKAHYQRYDLAAAAAAVGCSEADIEKVYKAFAATGKPDKAGTVMYALGWTQHTVGVQNIRTMAIIQLLLGNVGVAGGGVNALRGESNVQGATDQGVLTESWPGYLPVPHSGLADLAAYNKATTPVSGDPMSVNWWQNRPKYVASFLKAMYPGLTPEEAYSLMPRVDKGKKMTDYFWMAVFDRMLAGEVQGLFAWGQNPACSGANAGKNRKALAKLKWMVSVNLFDNETASFWHGPGVKPETVDTEVFLLPCATDVEKDGSITNSGRWIQWRSHTAPARGGVWTDGQMLLAISERLRTLYAEKGGAFPAPLKSFGSDLWKEGEEFSPAKVARLLNGAFVSDVTIDGKAYTAGQQVPGFALLRADGSTACGNWLHGGSWTEQGNMMARRDPRRTPEQERIGISANWSYSWPANRRIMYNRASVDKEGKPWNPEKSVILWRDGAWVGDVVDGAGNPGAKHPFIMQVHGLGALYGPGLLDGPFPEFYEPVESPFRKHGFSNQRINPTAFIAEGETFVVEDERFPYVCTTYRLTEQWQTGTMTRRSAWLLEAEPQVYTEIDPELARAKGIKNGDMARISSPRGSMTAVAMVTERIRPFLSNGKKVHLVGLSWQYGWLTPKDGGDSANLLSLAVGDPNVGIPETKAFMVNIEKA